MKIHSQARYSVLSGLAVRNKPIKNKNSGDNLEKVIIVIQQN